MVQQILKTKRGKWSVVLFVLAILGVVVSISDGDTNSIPIAMVLLVVAALLAFSAGKTVKDSFPSPEHLTIVRDDAKITIKTESAEYNIERFLAKGEKISAVDIGSNDNHYVPPTERQIDYLLSWDTTVPQNATKYDVSAILDRLENSYDVVDEKQTSDGMKIEYIRPLPGPSVEFAKYADSVGVHFSRFIGADALFLMVLNSIDEHERAAFFAYCVLCAHHRFDIGNLKDAPNASRLYEFADIVTQDAAVMKSILGRDIYDHKSPHKGSKAYKAVAEFFGIK